MVEATNNGGFMAEKLNMRGAGDAGRDRGNW